MSFAVIRCAGYSLVHAPNLLLHTGTTVTTERAVRPDSAFLAKLPGQLRNYPAAVAYPPNQTFIGNLRPEELAAIARPWHGENREGPRFGPFGEVMPEGEFYALLKLADSFDLVRLEAAFAAAIRAELARHPLLGAAAARIGEGVPPAELSRLVTGEGAMPLLLGDTLVGAVLRAHEHDEVLGAHVMLENLATKASAWLAALHTLTQAGVAPQAIDYVVECSEEACGDMNQRGGGNFAKAIAELLGCARATGSDTRAFCAAPAHSIITAAGLIQSGIYRNVLIVAGGALAKLGMNARDHVAKGLPVLEDMLGAFALLLTPDDGTSPRVRADLLGRLPVGAGTSPQAVLEALVLEPLTRAGLRLSDVDRYASELHNPEVTEPAGAGDVPRANYRMIAALAVKQGEITRAELDAFVQEHGVPGYAPTQGHIPSGVPYIGPALKAMAAGQLRRAMVIGKGSLFLGRMTSLFDGISFILEANPGLSAADPGLSTANPGGPRRLRIGLTLFGYELGLDEALRAAALVRAGHPDLEVWAIGPAGVAPDLRLVPAADEAEARLVLERLLAAGELDAAVTAHHAFPLGVATVARLRAPGSGRPFLLASTTGAAAPQRVDALVRNAVYGQAVAQALGWQQPTVGLLNLDGAAEALQRLERLAAAGYPIRLAGSQRAHGGELLRGNDLLLGAADVLVTDTLTGNLLLKLLHAAGSGGRVEVTGEGYGPGVGPGMTGIVCIVSRASAAAVIANAVGGAAELARGNLLNTVTAHLAAARAAGLAESPVTAGGLANEASSGPAKPPGQPAVPLTHEIPGVDILRLQEAAEFLSKQGVAAQPGMGCTGPVLLVAPVQAERSVGLLEHGGFLQR